MKSLSHDQLRRCKDILSFWHKVEFFIPFDLDGRVLEHNDKDWAVKTITGKTLNSLALDEYGALWQVSRVPEGKQIYGFDLYVGVFDKSCSVDIVQKAVRNDTLSALESCDQDERADLEGYTCFAKIQINASGEPLLDEISVSTLPWALGHVESGGLENLDITEFNHSLQQLKDDLQSFSANRRPQGSDGSTGEPAQAQKPAQLPITRRDLESLENVFIAWAGFNPVDRDAARFVIRAKAGKPPKPSTAAAPAQQPADQLETELPAEGRPAQQLDAEDDENEDEFDAKIDILNSFYLMDIQRAIQDVEKGRIPLVLQRYLQGQGNIERTDLYLEHGPNAIFSGLMPNLTPTARWMSDPAQPMSLMQQFAINNATTLLEKSGLYSVNGPPGTGKTTLLRDIFADIFVRRARVLARCESASDALCLDEKIRVDFDDGKHATITPLKKSLTGFEMIVASSNNAAVENISFDLPKTKSLGDIQRDFQTKEPIDGHWRKADGGPKHTYLQPVAHRIAAQNQKGKFESLKPDDTPWGLFAAVLGNRKNRGRFAERLSFIGKQGEPPPEGYVKALHQTIWDWARNPDSLSFAEAKKAFRSADKAVKQRSEEIQVLAELFGEQKGKTEAIYAKNEAKMAEVAEAARLRAVSSEHEADLQLRQCLTLLADLAEMERLLRDEYFPWWKRLVKRADYAMNQEKLGENREAQKEVLRRKMQLQQSADEAKRLTTLRSLEYLDAKKALDGKIGQWQARRTKFDDLRKKFPSISPPDANDELNNDEWQRNGLWRDDELAKMRSQLFAAALELQQAWLAEVLPTGKSFGGNVFAFCKMLKGIRLSNPEHALPIWQSLFMVVPVISSTFASIASQFRDLGADSLGWLFIDEAGQAVPQAAVGALWRSRRALVVGDPLQIEPVFTVPIKLIEALARISNLPSDLKVMPHRNSAQNLADEANDLGTLIESAGDGGQWVGSPLRVHRRCADPMFTAANAIAYEGKMVYGLKSADPPQDSLDLGGSAWVQVAGKVSHKQVVQEQVDTVLKALILLYGALEEMPPLYIISPFRAIKRELIERITKRGHWLNEDGAGQAPSTSELREWCKKHVGTVHTFQGKEKSIVWMVLGCDQDQWGGVAWASGKPNLLNVALTRAQHRFFMIGDANLWGTKGHFVTASGHLPTISTHDFYGRMSLAAEQARVA